MQLSKVQALQLTSISRDGPLGDHTHATLSRAFMQKAKDNVQSHILQIPMERTKMTLTLTSRRVSIETSQSDTDSDSEQDEPPAKRRCVPTKDTVKFLRSVVEKLLKNEKRKALANKFPLPSCDPAHPSKLDESIVCLIPKTARSYNRFLSKLQQFSMPYSL